MTQQETGRRARGGCSSTVTPARPTGPSRTSSYYLGAGVMILGGPVERVLGVDAERTSPEHVAEPLSVGSASTG